MNKGQCEICSEVGPITRNMCRKHYVRWWRTGDPLKVRNPEHRFYKNVFTLQKWNRWLAELNADHSQLAKGIDRFRQLCAENEPA